MQLDPQRLLPDGFDFYHLGRVETREGSPFPLFDLESALLGNESALSFQLRGDVSGTLLVLFDSRFTHGLDTSVYAELGNILASRVADRLNESSGLDVMISPPQTLGESGLKNIAKGPHTQKIAHRT